MQALLWPIVSWILRVIIVKFIILTSLFVLLAYLVPKALTYLAPWLTGASLSSTFAVVSPGVWFFLDFFQIGYGLPLLISAVITRFLIRRLPVIG